MPVCHECGSDVAEIDSFCPFCGISVQPIVVTDEQGDEAFESTIVMAPPATGEEKKIHDVPTPKLLEEFEGSSNVASKVSAVENVHDGGESPLATADDVVPIEIAEEPDESVESDSLEALEQASINEEAEANLVESPESGAEEPIAQEEAGKSYSAGVGSTLQPAAQISDKPEEAEIGEIQDLPPETEKPAPEAGDELFSERLQPTEEKISKPLDEFDAVDSFASQSMFDSVRIIETKNSDPKAEKVAPGNSTQNQSVPETAAGEAVSMGESASKATGDSSYTAQDLGVVDTDGKKSAKLKPLAEGTVLNGRYEIVRKIGGGGMGAVYLASDNNLGGVLRAVKEMVQTHIEEEQQDKAISDFKRESMILSTLDHPSIPTIYDYFYDEEESRFYLVMKYISGGDLASRLRSAPEGKIDEKTVTEWAIQISDVLHYLHSQPTTIVYRDLKPSNIMIDGNSGRVMLIDFGIARSINQKEEKGVTAVGTMGYAPPELFSGNVEPRSDIYSLGSTMFHLLTGADPQSNPLLIFDFQKNPRPRQINPQLSDQIERFLMRAVEYNAPSRFASAAEMRECLEDHIANLKTGNLTYGVKEIPTSVSLANQAVFCGFCGQKIVATDLFCAFCGAKQPIAQQGVHSEIYARGSMTAKLVIVGTSELETPAFSLDKDENLVGRRDPMSNIFPEVDLSKYDPQTKISRRHARIWREGQNFMVEDLGSSNGTVLVPAISDTLRLQPHQPHVLASGDKLKVGDTTLHFVIG